MPAGPPPTPPAPPCPPPPLLSGQGVPKPLYFNVSLGVSRERWLAFLPKVLHVMGDAEGLGGTLRTDAAAGRRTLESDMRRAPVAAFAASSDPRVVRALPFSTGAQGCQVGAAVCMCEAAV